MKGKTELCQPAPLLRIVPWLVAGILVEDAFACNLGAGPLAACVAATILLWRHPIGQSVGIGLCVLLTGMLLTARQRTALTFEDSQDMQTLEAVATSEAVARAKTVAIDLQLVHNGRRVKAYLPKTTESLSLLPGDGLVVRTRIEPTDTLHLGTFGYGRYLLVNGFTGRCLVRQGNWHRQAVGSPAGSHWDRLRLRALRWRHHIVQRYLAMEGSNPHPEHTTSAVLTAMTLGEKSALTRDLRDVYATTGASHVLALSGLHMGILFCLFTILVPPGRRNLLTSLLTVVLFWSFALLTGLSTSVTRSALMLSAATVFSLRSGQRSTLNVLCLSALLMLVVWPYALFDVSFQLSFLSVFAILMVVPVLDSFWPRSFLQDHRGFRLLWSLVAVSLAAQAGTAPLVAHYFGRLPVYFLITNLVVIPCAYAILWLSLAYLFVPISLLGRALLLVGSTMNSALTAIAAWPCASLSVHHPTAITTAMYYVIIVTLYIAVVRYRNIRVYI